MSALTENIDHAIEISEAEVRGHRDGFRAGIHAGLAARRDQLDLLRRIKEHCREEELHDRHCPLPWALVVRLEEEIATLEQASEDW